MTFKKLKCANCNYETTERNQDKYTGKHPVSWNFCRNCLFNRMEYIE
ncbi:MAG: hypothetical protein ACOCV1_06805 [Bacillota bacterium]